MPSYTLEDLKVLSKDEAQAERLYWAIKKDIEKAIALWIFIGIVAMCIGLLLTQ